MNKNTKNIFYDLIPMMALIVYKNEETNLNYYIESHEIIDGKMVAGKPLKQETIQNIVDTFYKSNIETSTIKGLMPSNLLQYKQLTSTNYKLVWFTKSHNRKLYFADQLHIKNGFANVPTMLWVAKNDYLEVYALNNDDHPKLDSDLFHAPFHNVNPNGNVCLGNAKLELPKIKTFDSMIQYYETLFWNTEFSHLAGSFNPTKSNLNSLWKKLTNYPHIFWMDIIDELKPSKIKIENLI